METEKSIFFWKENNKFGYLSNFYTSHFVDAINVKYTCIEQYFIANKCLLFDESNTQLYNRIMNTNLPFTIKKIGRQVAYFDQSIWDRHKPYAAPCCDYYGWQRTLGKKAIYAKKLWS